MDYVFGSMFVGAEEVLGLIQDGFTDFVDIFGVGMLALSLPAEALLAKANALGLVIDDILLDRLFSTLSNTVFCEIILTILRKKVLSSYFFDGRIEVCAVIEFFFAGLVIITTRRAHHICEG